MNAITTISPRRQRFQVGFIAGLGAGLLATAVMLILNLTTNSLSLPEQLGAALTLWMPLDAFQYLHQVIGIDAKHYLFDILLVGQCLVFALAGGLFNRFVQGKSLLPDKTVDRKKRNRSRGIRPTNKVQKLHWTQGILFAALLWLVTGLVLLPLLGDGVFGAVSPNVSVASTMFSLAVIALVYGLIFVPAQNWFMARSVAKQEALAKLDDDEAESRLSRRKILKQGAMVAGVALVGVVAWRFITQGARTASIPMARLVQNFKNKIVPPPVPNYGDVHPAQFLSPEITPNDQYYIVSKNLFADPTVDKNTWRLVVSGHVDHPFELTYDQLLALPMQKQYESMMCISNEVGGEYMSSALWEGIPLKDLLARAGVQSGAVKVVFYAADDYSDSIHLDKAMESTTLLAVRMNGANLPQGHGFPARMLVPGIYGMKHCKWLNRVSVVLDDFQGYWQQRGWTDPAPIRLTARIDTPLIGTTVSINKTTYIAGVAFSGNKGISEVDVTTDGGMTWQRATLKHPLSDLTWVLWELPWQPTKTGDYVIAARAIDLQGNVQDPQEAPPLPDGSSGYHTIDLTVA